MAEQVNELVTGLTTQRASVLRSHAGEGKEFAWQRNGLPANAANGDWHFAEAKRVGSHASLKLDGQFVMISDNVPDWGSGFDTGSVLRVGKNFHGWIDEVKVHALGDGESARAFYDQRPRDRDGDGALDNAATPTAKASAEGISPPAGLDMFTGKHSFLPCVHEEVQERTFWLGTNAASATSKTIDCPYW